jgi:hypothetical protein
MIPSDIQVVNALDGRQLDYKSRNPFYGPRYGMYGNRDTPIRTTPSPQCVTLVGRYMLLRDGDSVSVRENDPQHEKKEEKQQEEKKEKGENRGSKKTRKRKNRRRNKREKIKATKECSHHKEQKIEK